MLLEQWALHNTLKGWTLFDLTSNEVQLLVSAMSVNEVKLSKVCKKDSTSWAPLREADYPDFFIKKNITAKNKYPELGNEEKTSEGHTDTEYFVVRPRSQVPRLHNRFEIEVACSISSSRNSFTTKTIDLSEGGLFFKDILPDWIAGYFIVKIIDDQSIYQLMCSLVEDQKEKRRVQIVSEDSDLQYMLFKAWLHSYNNKKI